MSSRKTMTRDELWAWRARMVEELVDANDMFEVLGVIGGRHHFLLKETGAVVAFRLPNRWQLSQLASKSWWRNRFPSEMSGGYDSAEVVNALFRASECVTCHRREAGAERGAQLAIEKAKTPAAVDVF